MTDDRTLYHRAVADVVTLRRVDVAWLARRHGLSAEAAAGMVERMEREGVVSPADAVGARQVLAEVAPEAGEKPPWRRNEGKYDARSAPLDVDFSFHDEAPGDRDDTAEDVVAELIIGGLSSSRARMLVLLVHRIERIDDEIADLRADRSDVRKEAKAHEFDLKALDVLLRRRKMEPELRRRLDELVPLYEAAVGLPGEPVDGGVLTGAALLPAPAPKPLTKKQSEARKALLVGRMERAAEMGA